MENANDFIALEGAATRQCLAILNQSPVPHHSLALEHEKNRTPPSPTTRWRWSTKKPAHPLSHHPLAFFLHANAGCIWEPGNVLQGIAL
ncbi:MAG: hypothetical protein SPL28_03810 [Bacteroidales bacterium]|nr:hypothetical protein [Bacteroidales bacterium]